eukprot:COSAG01_NODE_42807_length_436_cov_1.059347_1_plen_74_part_01
MHMHMRGTCDQLKNTYMYVLCSLCWTICDCDTITLAADHPDKDMYCFSGSCFFKQKTAYEILRSDWSSDVCSSD